MEDEYQDRDRIEYEDEHGFIYPTWIETRKLIKGWGVIRVSRDVVDLIIIIIREKEIRPEKIERFLKPIILESIEEMKSDKQNRLFFKTTF